MGGVQCLKTKRVGEVGLDRCLAFLSSPAADPGTSSKDSKRRKTASPGALNDLFLVSCPFLPSETPSTSIDEATFIFARIRLHLLKCLANRPTGYPFVATALHLHPFRGMRREGGGGEREREERELVRPALFASSLYTHFA
jgi:hypothetical protein